MPKISVIIPYNIDRGYLQEAVASIVRQTHRKVQIVPVHSDANCSTNINQGVQLATADWIKILAEDDLLPRDSLEILWSIAKTGRYDWVCGDAQNFGMDETLFVGKEIVTFSQMLCANLIHGGSPLYHRRCFEETGGFDESLPSREEYDFHLRLLKGGYKRGYVPGIVYLYRTHIAQKSLWIKDKGLREALNEKIRKRYSS